MSITVRLLADRLADAPAVADLRCQEWGHAPEPTDPAFWLATTLREAGRDTLPVTYVACDDDHVVGAVGMDVRDLDEWHDEAGWPFRDVTPWVTGMIVAPDRRERGVGRQLMGHLEQWAIERGIEQAWVATEIAAGFYERCGWMRLDTLRKANGDTVDILTKVLRPAAQ